MNTVAFSILVIVSGHISTVSYITGHRASTVSWFMTARGNYRGRMRKWGVRHVPHWNLQVWQAELLFHIFWTCKIAGEIDSTVCRSEKYSAFAGRRNLLVDPAGAPPSDPLIPLYRQFLDPPWWTAGVYDAVVNDAGKRDAQAQLDGLLEEVNKRKSCLEELERRAVAAALVEERMRLCVLVGCLKPVAVSIMHVFSVFINSMPHY